MTAIANAFDWVVDDNSKLNDNLLYNRVGALVKKEQDKCSEFTNFEKITGWLNGRKPWEKLFWRILKNKGVECAYVSTKPQEEKFYAIVSENSIEKMMELSKIYNEFLDSYTKYTSDPYFDFVIFGKDEIEESDIDTDLVLIR